MAKEWGTPDWTDAAAYETYAGLSRHALRWQFLRRHPAYRQAWLQAAKAPPLDDPDWSRRYGLSLPHNPKENAGPPKFYRHDSVIVLYGYTTDDAKKIVEEIAANGMLLAVIDPSINFDENVRNIREDYENIIKDWGEKPTLKRNKDEAVVIYLRILDAKAAIPKVKNSQIADALPVPNPDSPPDEQSVDKHYHRARTYSEKITGVAWPPSPKAKSPC